MKRKLLWILGIGAVVLLIMGMGRCLEIRNRQTDPYLQIAEEIYRVETALKEVDEDYQCESISKVTPFTYTDSEGNTIVYYCCQTAYVTDEPMEYNGLNMDAIGMVINISQIGNKRKCTVNEYDAFLCEINDRTYLCWTLEPKTSCVIEYDAEKTAQEDILRMAESVSLENVDVS